MNQTCTNCKFFDSEEGCGFDTFLNPLLDQKLWDYYVKHGFVDEHAGRNCPEFQEIASQQQSN